MKNYIKLMRPHHYIKNILIFFPIVFSGNFFDSKLFLTSLFAFLSFSLATSFIYIINDIRDKEKDKRHEKKKSRPIAAEIISVKNAIIFALTLFIFSMFFSYLTILSTNHLSYLYIIIYILINITYSLKLKTIPIIDVFILVIGFLIRVVYGASVIGVDVSNWLYLTIMAISFYLALGKRRNEIKKSGSESREVLKYYNESFLDKNMYMFLSMSIVFYALWTIDLTNVYKFGNKLIFTVPVLILIFMKYSMDIENDNFGDPIDIVLKDRILFIMSLLYGIMVLGIIYI